ncbi:MAG: hypothetical protein LUC98_00885 [Lachnospiraceae bacterium]|nr:hypothetical protein [Lachnospiraceae bacterium]
MIDQILPEFVEEIPQNVEDGYLYLCLPYNAVIHRCACGCGEIISTPLDKSYGWVMQYDGEAVTLSPSVGNGAYKCRSHYYIRENRIVWLDKREKHTTDHSPRFFRKIEKILRRLRWNKFFASAPS